MRAKGSIAVDGMRVLGDRLKLYIWFTQAYYDIRYYFQ